MSEQVTDETVVFKADNFPEATVVELGDLIEPYRHRLLDYDKVVAENERYKTECFQVRTFEAMRDERDELTRKYREAMELLEMVYEGKPDQCLCDMAAICATTDRDCPWHQRYEALKKDV